MGKAPAATLVTVAVISLGMNFLTACRFDWSETKPTNQPESSEIKRSEARSSAGVAALGTLEPHGDVHVLASPTLQLGGAPRVRSILVEEGERVRAGQLLATFDNYDNVRSERNRVLANINSKNSEIAVLESETNRYRSLQNQGAVSKAELESRELQLLGLKAQLSEFQAILKEVNTKFQDTELRAPISGYVLKLNARVGERAGSSGVMEIGNSDRMEAVLQVDESDISSITLDQPVFITSENRAFSGSLEGRVSLIGVKVSERRRISVDPTLDSDVEARVIDVRVSLLPDDSARVRDLVGAKVLGEFKSKSIQ
jgi:HlyD family secretion protein